MKITDVYITDPGLNLIRMGNSFPFPEPVVYIYVETTRSELKQIGLFPRYNQLDPISIELHLTKSLLDTIAGHKLLSEEDCKRLYEIFNIENKNPCDTEK